MNKKKIYLAGPISGLNWSETESWRDSFKEMIEWKGWSHIVGYSPLREKGFLTKVDKIADNYEDSLFSSQRAIMSRDFFDVQTADAIIANFTGSKKVSIGTVMEVAWAYQRRIPTIIVAERGNMHEHSMMREAANWWVHDLHDAVDVVGALFTP
jgi:nucleoside 2-deoxyribosyltransferase